MHVVSDTSPLSCLASIRRLDLIESQFSSVYVPPAVKAEMLHHPAPWARDLFKQAIDNGWIIEDVGTGLLPLALLLNHTLDQGEAEAISLAANRRAELLLIDEREGRKVARGLGLYVTGTLGILIRAKLDGALDSLGETLEDLCANFSFSLAPDLVKRALREVGEL
jgi:predicted nucleic acid-binding protein